MLNLSTIAVFIIKWWNKIINIKPSPFYLLMYTILLLGGIYIYIQWTDIPTKAINMDIYEFKHDNRDTVLVNIAINLNLYKYKGRVKEINPPKKSLIEIGFHSKELISKDKSRKTIYSQNDFNQYNRLKNAYSIVSQLNIEKKLNINIDSLNHIIGIDIKTEGVIPSLLILGQTNKIHNALDGYKECFFLSDSLYVDIHNYLFKPHYVAKASFICGFNDFAPSNTVTYQSSIFSNPFSFFALEDISQQYLKIKINTHNPLNGYYYTTPIQIQEVKVNTVGASDIKYKTLKESIFNDLKSNSRLDGVDIEGNVKEILLYIDSKEGASLQSLRMFFLTTILTVIITLLLGTLFSILKNTILRKKRLIKTLSSR